MFLATDYYWRFAFFVLTAWQNHIYKRQVQYKKKKKKQTHFVDIFHAIRMLKCVILHVCPCVFM